MSSPGLEIQVCAECAARYFPAHFSCAKCGAMNWKTEIAGAAAVESLTVSRRRAGAGTTEPVTIVLVRTESGVPVIARGDAGLREGQKVDLSTDGSTPVAKARNE